MKLVKIYEDIIREGKAQGCLVKFGNELFDPQLSDDSDVEANTETEDEYLKLIHQFTTYNHGRALRPVFIDAMKTLKGCMSSYPEVLQPAGVAYRSDIMLLNDLLSQYEDIEDDLSKGGEFDFTYTPKSLIQSWSSDKYAAMGFAKPSPLLLQMMGSYKKVKDDPTSLANFAKEVSTKLDDVTVPILVKLNTSTDDFLFKSKYFKSLSQYDYEEELLRINNQPVRVTSTIINPFFKPVFGILKAIRQYQLHLSKQ